MGCTSEKSIPVSSIYNNKKLLTEDNIIIDLHDIEKQGESKHPQKEINIEEIQEEKNFYNYNLNDLVLVNNTKMTVKRLENFVDDDDDDEESDDDNELENIEEENNDEENINNENNNNERNDNDENKNVLNEEENNINKIEDKSEKKPEDKKPPNIEKLKKKGKEKKEINFF